MSEKTFDLNSKSARKRAFQIYCPLIDALLGLTFLYFYLPLFAEIALGVVLIIFPLINLAKRNPMRWWKIVLLTLGVICIVGTIIFPLWLLLIITNPLLIWVFVGFWIGFGIVIVVDERRVKKIEI